jgi:phosphodiesterase/alkaline phosphatase D-like protein
MPTPVTRRTFLRRTTLAGVAMATTGWLEGPVAAQPPERARPAVPHGVQSGDVGHHSPLSGARPTARPA